jgi:transcriptional regulator with XRE-family HTH domain
MKPGDRIKALRKERGLSQSELGEIVGLTFSALSAIEVNKNSPSWELIVELSNFFEVSTDYLLKGIETERTISKSELEILEVLRGDRDMTNAMMEVAKVKKKAISFTRSYAAANQNAVLG